MRAKGHESKGNLMIVTIFWVAIWMSLVNQSIQVLEQCLAYPPCTCTGSSVGCGNKGLTTFPRFIVANVSQHSIHFRLEHNRFRTIPSDSFNNLTVSNSTLVLLFLHNNNLNSIATHAFNGIANRLTTLFLDDNKFTAIPSALGQLTRLKTLYLRNNPIVTLSTSEPELHALGRTLTKLYLDMKYFKVWPIELNYLHTLTSLNLKNVQQHCIYNDAFEGLKNTLHSLRITNSKLEKIPFAICHLENLRELYFTDNTNISINSRVFEPCVSPLTHVGRVDIYSDNLRYMPDVFETFPSMTFLSMYDNQLSYIDSDTILSNTSLTTLFISRNNFTRIPTAVNKLSSLKQLLLMSNKIVSVEGSDLKDLINLSNLDLSNNPIEYISSQAFTTNRALERLDLSRTKLRFLPASLTGLDKLTELDLGGNPTECTCKLLYLGASNMTNTDIQGACDKIDLPVKTYIKEDLPGCP